MRLMEPSRRRSIEALANLHYCNPFLEERIALEREALGAEFRDAPAVRTELYYANEPNLELLGVRIEEETARMRQRLVEGAVAGDVDLTIYEDLVLYLLYRRYRLDLEKTLGRTSDRSGRVRILFWDRFLADTRHFLALPGHPPLEESEAARLLADSFQVCRAFANIFNTIIGTSARSAKLRAAVWESIFTHDMHRYRRSLYQHMGDLPTLITGPSGTGKELVASAVGLSRYVPFDHKTRKFDGNYAESFHPLNLSALAPTLIESELFGHKEGAFTGALADRKGWLEECGPLGSVFLDEIGDLDMALQLKLLRVLQERTFQKLGDTRDIKFKGKFIAATHRDLAAGMRDRRFRQDLYFRLCADMIVTPSLREQLNEAPGDLHLFVLFIAKKIAKDEAEGIAREAEQWITAHLDRGYPWPGNFRELEQCVRNVMIRKEYHPAAASEGGDHDPRRALAADVHDGTLSLPQLERRYCTLIYSETRDYVRAAERLKIDRRTLKSKIDPGFLERLG